MTDRLIVFGYLAVLVFVGLHGGKGVKNADDFTATGKRYGMWVIFATLSASFVGGGYSSGNAAAAYDTGIGTALTLFGFSIGMLIIGKWFVPGVARFPHAKTVGGIIGAVYGERARQLSGIIAFFCCAGVVGAQMESIGLVFQSLLGVPAAVGTLIGGAVVLIYTTFGGMASVLVADILQFVLLAAGMPLLLAIAVTAGGGASAVWERIPPDLLNPLNGRTLPAFLSLFFAMMCGEALAPPYMQRLLIGKTPRDTARGTMLSGLFSMPFFLVTAGVGLTARALGIEQAAASIMPDLILRILPVGLRGILMAAMASIMLSAADGFLNGATTGLVCDTILPRYPHLSDKAQLRTLRTVNFATGVTAMVLSFLLPNVFDILLLAYSFWSPVILVPLAAALLGITVGKNTFYGCMAGGLVTCLVWNTLLARPYGVDGAAIGLAVNLLIFCIGKKYSRNPLDKL